MKFHNPTPRTQRFEINKRQYNVPPGAEVEIPDQFVYLVRSRGMVLEQGPAPVVDGQAAPVAEVLEVIPESVEMLLSSKFILPEERDPIRAAYRASRGDDRTQLVARLALQAQGRGAGEDPDEHPAEPAGGAGDDADGGDADTTDAMAQINAAAAGARIRRGRTS